MQSKSLNSDSGVIFSPPSIVKNTLGESGILLAADMLDDEADGEGALPGHSNQVDSPPSNYTYFNPNIKTETLTTTATTQTNDNATESAASKTPILNTILKSKPSSNPNMLISAALQLPQRQHTVFNPYADENDGPSYNFQLSKMISNAAAKPLQESDSNQLAAAAVGTSTPTPSTGDCFAACAQPQALARTFGFNRTNLMSQWMPASASSPLSSAGSSTTPQPMHSLGHCSGVGGGGGGGNSSSMSSANVSRFQIRSVSAEHLFGHSSCGSASSAGGFRPLLPLNAVRPSGSGGGGGGDGFSPFADENSSSSNFVDDAMTFKSYDLNDEYWLNFE